MSKFALFVVFLYISGFFIMPTYHYTAEESSRLIRQPTIGERVLWPVRAYKHWSLCSTIGECEKARCATLRGGCQPTLGSGTSSFPTKLTKPQEDFFRNHDKEKRRLDDAWMRNFDRKTEKPPQRQWKIKNENFTTPISEPQRKIIQNKLRKVDNVWKNLNFVDSTKRYTIGELPEIRTNIDKANSVDRRFAQNNKAAVPKSNVPWGPLTGFRNSPQKGATTRRPNVIERNDNLGTPKPKDSLDLKTFRNDAFGAYTKALDEGKFTVIQFGSEYCGFCKNLMDKLGDPALAKYVDRVVVSDTNGDMDPGARQLEEALGVVRYPTLVVLKTNKTNIHVAGRIEGEVSVPEIDRIFQEAMKHPIRK